MRFTGCPIVEGTARGELLVSQQPITFYGGVDPLTSEVVEPSHPLKGARLAGRILVIPHSKGSTVGSYIILRMAKRGIAPAGIVTVRPDEVVIVGCVIGGVVSMTGVHKSVLSSVKSGSIAELHVRREHAELVVE